MDLSCSQVGSTWTEVDDGDDYSKPYTIQLGSFFSTVGATQQYLDAIGDKLYATVGFAQKEEDDGYQYVQILADNTTAYDGKDPDGGVNRPSTSLYKAAFILSKTGSGSVESNEHFQFFPHRYDYHSRTDSGQIPSHSEFEYYDSYLYAQAFKADSYRAATSGSLVLPATTNSLTVRFDAAGIGEDTWYFRNLFARVVLVDDVAPTLLSGGIHVSQSSTAYGNEVVISLPFSEIVKAATPSSTTLQTTWGSFNLLPNTSGVGNVLSFKGRITASAGTALQITGLDGTVQDMTGNSFAWPGTQNLNLSSTAAPSYTISYDLGGGAFNGSCPTSYSWSNSSVTLTNPTRTGYTFTGWTGTDLSEPTMSVSFIRSFGDRQYIANWQINQYAVTFKGDAVIAAVFARAYPLAVAADRDDVENYVYSVSYVGEYSGAPLLIAEGAEVRVDLRAATTLGPVAVTGADGFGYRSLTFILTAPASFGPADFTLPAFLTELEESAFEGAAMTAVDASHCETVGKWAFKDCGSLTRIRLPENCAIHDQVFDGCGTVYVFAPAGGTAESYCAAHNNCVFVAEAPAELS